MSDRVMRYAIAAILAGSLAVLADGGLTVAVDVATVAAMESTPQLPPEQYPGQSEHKEPPDGWVCSNHPSAPAGHECACNPTCEKNEDGTVTLKEDSKCSSYCWMEKHCTCGHQCQSTH